MTTQTGVVSWSQTAASNASADSNVNWAEGQAPSSVNDSARAEMASVAKYRDDTAGSLTTGGTSTAYTLTTNQVFSSLTVLNGQELSVKFNATNGASPTLNVDGLGAKAINITAGVAVPSNFFVPGTPYALYYNNSTPEFVVRGIVGAIPSGTALTGPATDDKLLIEDVSATAPKYITLANLLTVVNSLTADASPDASADYVISYDASASAAKKILLNNLPASLPRGYIDGLTLANGTDAVNDINISAGKCRDSTDAVDIVFASAINGKQLDANWAAGGSAGMRDTAAGIANTTYHIYAVRTAASSAGDIYATTQTTASAALTAIQAETGGASYAYARRIGSIVRTGGSIKAFYQINDTFIWDVPVLDVSAAAVTTSSATYTITVPTGLVVEAFFNVAQLGNGIAIFVHPYAGMTGIAASATVNPLATVYANSGSGPTTGDTMARAFTNTSAAVKVTSAASTTFSLSTLGYVDRRGRDS